MAGTAHVGEARSQSNIDKRTDARWLAKQSEIIAQASGACQRCGSSEDLVVHQTHYEVDEEPWECGDDFLMCLCEMHDEQELDHWQLKQQLIKEISRHHVRSQIVSRLIYSLNWARWFRPEPPQEDPCALNRAERFMLAYTQMLDHPRLGEMVCEILDREVPRFETIRDMLDA